MAYRHVAILVLLFYAAAARSEDVAAAVEAGNRAFIAAFLRGDSAAVAALYTDDAQVMGPGSPVASGRAAIAAFWQGSIDSGIQNVELRTADVVTAGDLAAETGTVVLVDKDGKPSQARYVVVWQRTDGRWLMHRDIWNAGP
jgi:uncharacterized protein (TIGR02246 family)